MISNCTLGSGSVLTPRRPLYGPGEVAWGAYCVGALRRDCARAGEAIDAIMAIITAMQIGLMAHLRCERHLVRRRRDCNHSGVHAGMLRHDAAARRSSSAGRAASDRRTVRAWQRSTWRAHRARPGT